MRELLFKSFVSCYGIVRGCVAFCFFFLLQPIKMKKKDFNENHFKYNLDILTTDYLLLIFETMEWLKYYFYFCYIYVCSSKHLFLTFIFFRLEILCIFCCMRCDVGMYICKILFVMLAHLHGTKLLSSIWILIYIELE